MEWRPPIPLDVVAIEKGAFGSPSTKVINFTYYLSLDELSSNLDDAVCAPLYTNTLGKGINPNFFYLLDKRYGILGSLVFAMAINQEERQF